MIRQTKIVASLGPATDDPLVLAKMFEKGVDVVRINFSHGDAEDHRVRVDLVRKTAKKAGKIIAILGDLQGPKIRLERFKKGKINLVAGEVFNLDGSLGKNDGDESVVGLTYKALAEDVKKGDILNERNLSVKRPGTGISPMKWDEVFGSIAEKNYSTDDLI